MSFNRKRLVVWCSFVFGIAGSARADQMSDMQQQLEALQKQIQQLQSQMEVMKREQAVAPPTQAPARPAGPAATTDNFIEPGRTLTFDVAGSKIQIYGHVDVSLDTQTNGMSGFMNNGAPVTGNNGWMPDISSNLSYFGVRGSRNLGADLRGLFQFETEVAYAATPGASDQAPDATAQKYSLGSRNSFVGLEGRGWGAVKLGKTDTPYKTSTARLDPFASTPGDYNAIIGNSGGDNRTEFDMRLPHSIWYESPKWGGLNFAFLASPGQNRSTNSGLYAQGEPDCSGGNSTGGINGNDGPPLVPSLCEDGSFKDAYSLAVMYQAGPLYLTGGYELHKNVNRIGDEIDPGTIGVRDESAYKIGIQYKFPTHTTVNFEFERMHRNAIVQDLNERTRNGTWLAVTQGLTPTDDLNLAWAHAGRTPGQPAAAVQDRDGNVNPTGPSDNGANLYDIGWKHHFDSQTSIYFVYARLVNEHWGHYSLGAGGHGLPTRNYVGDKFNGGCAEGGNCGLFTGYTAQAFSLGMQYDF